MAAKIRKINLKKECFQEKQILNNVIQHTFSSELFAIVGKLRTFALCFS